MASNLIFSDSDNNELQCSISDGGKVTISVGKRGAQVSTIKLDENDLSELIRILAEMQEEMEG